MRVSQYWGVLLLLSIGTLVVVAQQFPFSFSPGPPGGPGTPPFLQTGQTLRLESLHAELKLSATQKKEILDTAKRAESQVRQILDIEDFAKEPQVDDDRRPSPFQRFETQFREIDEQLAKRLSKFLDDKQLQRFSQIQLQRRGLRALLQDDIARELQLSDDQRQKLQDIADQSPPPFAPTEERQRSETDALAVLDEKQAAAWAQRVGKPFDFPPPEFGPGFGGPGGPFGGPGGPRHEDLPIVEKFDANHDGWLNRIERDAAREFVKSDVGRRDSMMGPHGPPRPGGRRGGRGPMGRGMPPAKPGPHVSPADVMPIDAPLYDPTVLRTILIEFDHADWETELSDFHGTDVEVPATLIVGVLPASLPK